MARSLRTGTTKVLGVIVIDVANHFHSKLSRALEDRAPEHGYRVMICSSDEKDFLLEEWVDELVDNRVASYNATSLLLKEEYRKIAVIAFEPVLDTMKQRIEGYKRAIVENGLKVDKKNIRTISYEKIGEQVDAHVTDLVLTCPF